MAAGEPSTPRDPLPIRPLDPNRPPHARVRPPGSKSITNRALLLSALAGGRSVLRDALTDADDAQRMVAAVQALGARVERQGHTLRVEGVSGRWRVGRAGVRLDLHNAGTATRFLTAAAVLADGPVTIDGNARMRERPIAELARVLPTLGAVVEYAGREGFPPLTITPQSRPPRHPTIELPTTQSSQFISALLMLGPWLPGGVTLRLRGEVTSRPYILMTLRLLDRLGASVRASDDLRLVRTGPGEHPAGEEARGLGGFELDIEPDASGASYFWAAGAMAPGASVTVEGLTERSVQGDAAFPELLRRMGAGVERDAEGFTAVTGPQALRPIDADMSDMPDTAMTIASVCVFAPGRSVLRGLRTLRVKETDRIAAMQRELRKVGVRVETDVPEDPDALSITPPEGGIDLSPSAPRVEFDTYDDHRMAMSLALIGLRRPNCFVRDPMCVGKTYAMFWRDLSALFQAKT